MKSKKKPFYRLAALIFLFILTVLLFVNMLTPDKKSSSEENRVLQTLPVFSLSEYLSGRFESKLEDYVNDQFAGRNQLIRVKTAADKTRGILVSNGVISCRDHYLMEELTVPDEENLKKTEQALKAFKKDYPAVKMYFLLAPNAANILTDKLPATVTVSDQDQYMDNFFKTMKSSDITPVDVRETLEKNSKTEQLYYRTDHHWTTDGAYFAFAAAAKKMGFENNIKYKSYVVKNDFRGTLSSTSGFTNGRDDTIKIYLPGSRKNYNNSVIYFSDTKKKTTNFYEMENLKIKDAYTVFGGSNHPYYTIETPTESEEILLLLKDSYANCMIPFLSQKYRKIIVVDPRYYFDSIGRIMESEEVTQVLFLYNANTFFEDTTLNMALSQ